MIIKYQAAGMDSFKGLQGGFNKTLIGPKASSLLIQLSGLLKGKHIRAYLVGGSVRDVLLGRDTADIDIAIDADVLKIAPQLADSLHGKFVLLDEINKIGRIIIKDWTIDLASFSGDIEDDLTRRDFTIDAMAVDLQQLLSDSSEPALIDPFNGQADLDKGIIRLVTPTAFKDDPVRLLRALRLATEFDFTIDRKTETELKQFASLIAGVPRERVREELLRVFNHSHGGQVFRDMDKLGLLTALIPELLPLKGVAQPKEHYWDVFEHSINTVSAVDFILHQGVWEYHDKSVLSPVPWTSPTAEYFDQPVNNGSTRRSLVKLAALLHDITKPQTKAFDENSRMRFLGHPESGADVAAGILERLRFSTKEIKLVTLMVKYHLRPTQMNQDALPTSRAIYRYFRDVGDVGIDTLYLSLADHLATRGPKLLPDQWEYHTQLVAYILKEHLKQKKAAPLRLINGNDLIDVFGMKPGVKMGELLELIHEAQASGELTTREAALDYVKKYLA